ncbi:hypothetical protein WA556_000945, partial [Blastocystis sp. ATCC 50177/Nand II]
MEETGLRDLSPGTNDSQWNTQPIPEESLSYHDDMAASPESYPYLGNETALDRCLFNAEVLVSCVSYAIAVLKYFPTVCRNPFVYSCWTTLGTATGIVALLQSEGFSVSRSPLLKQFACPLLLCAFLSMTLSMWSGYTNRCSLALLSSFSQCITLLISLSLYVPLPMCSKSISVVKAK